MNLKKSGITLLEDYIQKCIDEINYFLDDEEFTRFLRKYNHYMCDINNLFELMENLDVYFQDCSTETKEILEEIYNLGKDIILLLKHRFLIKVEYDEVFGCMTKDKNIDLVSYVFKYDIDSYDRATIENIALIFQDLTEFPFYNFRYKKNMFDKLEESAKKIFKNRVPLTYEQKKNAILKKTRNNLVVKNDFNNNFI